MARGRPAKYSDAVTDEICQRLANGESLNAMCKSDNLPSITTVINWLADERYAAFLAKYVRAREAQADTLFDQILEIADTPFPGITETVKPDGTVETKKEDMLGHRRLQVDARKWAASKLAPKKYGDKLDIDANLKVGLLPSSVDDYL
jgi:hypothetical protein